MTEGFKIESPLFLESDSFELRFSFKEASSIDFDEGLYFLRGDNGSGKTSFVNLLALTLGKVGRGKREIGNITFNGEPYRGGNLNYIRAAEIREKYFCIFPQKSFFLPVSTRDNYLILNNTDRIKAESFSPGEYPDLLSGGQQQKILMDILLDHKKPIWFLDEPLTNMDTENRLYFWKKLMKSFRQGVQMAFFIDHWIDPDIREENGFRHYGTIFTSETNSYRKNNGHHKYKEIEIRVNRMPESFFRKQIERLENTKL